MAIPLLVMVIAAVAIFLPILIGFGAISFKVIGLLFFTKAGPFPIWTLFVLFILGFILMRKARKKGYYP